MQNFKPNCEITLYHPNATVPKTTYPNTILELLGDKEVINIIAVKLNDPKDAMTDRRDATIQIKKIPALLEFNREQTYKDKTGNKAVYTLAFLVTEFVPDAATLFKLPDKTSFKVALKLLDSPVEFDIIKWDIVSGPFFDPISNMVEMLISPIDDGKPRIRRL